MDRDSSSFENLFLSDFEGDDATDRDDLFLDAMADVRPIPAKNIVPRKNGPRRIVERSEEEDGRVLLNAFIQGRSEFDWSFHPGYQEGGSEYRNGPLLKKLRRGAFSVQAELDLHGLTQPEAQAKIEQFLQDSYDRNIRCVRIIHGKGLNSRHNIGVLKRKLPQWLSIRRLSRLIIAFASAPPNDGGVGATLVLLRKKPLPPPGVRRP